jgi:serine/threonine-protein kinase
MDDTAAPFPPHEELARLLPGYRLDPEPLHATNMSQVYLATDTRLHHRKVAVKIIADYLAAHPVYRKRFLREIQLMASLEHPNIMYIITASAVAEQGEQDRLLYLVMPRADHDLRKLLEAGALDLAKTADVVSQTAKALDFAHDRGVVHRDVKPGNILFGPDGHVYLCDFGVAKEHFGEDLTSTGETIGTRRFTAPEVFDARSGDAETTDPPSSARMLPCTPHERSGDVYSLGAVLYHCLTGRRPFDDVDDHAAVSAQQTFELVPVSALRDNTPPGVDQVVAKAMHRDPDERYNSCGELAAALSQALGLSGAGSALPILRDIQDRLRSEPADRDPTTVYPGSAPAPAALPGGSAPDTRYRLLSVLVSVLAVALAGGLLLYQLFEPDDAGADSASGGSGAGSSSAASESPTANLEPPSPTVEPVTGDGQETRRPVEGECLNDDPEDYVVVACDSEAAVELVYKIVIDPVDPNPAQPDHEDARWEACKGEGYDFVYETYWKDSLDAEDTERAWDPEADRIYYIMCYVEL